MAIDVFIQYFCTKATKYTWPESTFINNTIAKLHLPALISSKMKIMATVFSWPIATLLHMEFCSVIILQFKLTW